MYKNRNLIVAIGLSVIVLFSWQYFVAGPQMKAEQQKQAELLKEKKEQAAKPASLPQELAANTILSRGKALQQSARVKIDTPTVDGSLSLKGARFDDLQLKHYHETVDPKSPEIVLFSPRNTAFPYYAVYGWVAAPGDNVKLPDDNSVWTLQSGTVLSPDHPVTLTWNNGQGLVFTRTISVDNQYMFTVKDTVTNQSANAHTLYPFAYVARDGVPPETRPYWSLHEGFVGVADGSLKDANYSDIDKNEPPQNFQSTGGWLGITDKYWMAAVVPPQSEAFDGNYRGTPYRSTHAYQADYRLGARTLQPGQTLDLTQHLFAGAKVVSMLQEYENRLGIVKFDYAIDWGWYSFFTRPIFWILSMVSRALGNVGLAIIAFALLAKFAFAWFANSTFGEMRKIKYLRPQVDEINKQFPDDMKKRYLETLDLYKQNGVIGSTGILPMVFLWTPLWFSLYKIFLVTIEFY